MTEENYLRSLEGELQILKEAERNDILRDFREYFASGRAEGKTDESIAESLGTAEELAVELLKAYSEEEFITNVEVKPTIINSFSKVDIESELADLIILPSEDDKLRDGERHRMVNGVLKSEKVKNFQVVTE